jgi:hypothetical protein
MSCGWMMGEVRQKIKYWQTDQQLVRKRELFIVNDRDGTPTFTIDLPERKIVI